MTRTDSVRGRTALAVAQCAGMVDLVALPVWVGTLVLHYKFDPQQSGLLVTLFLSGAVLSSIVIAPLFHRLKSGRWVAAVAFAAASLIFFTLSQTSSFEVMALLHGIGGLAIGAALSVKDGTIARSANPHRLFAMCGAALGAFALVFLSTVPPLVAQYGGPLFFRIFAAVMLVGAVTSLLAFPALDAAGPAPAPAPQSRGSSTRMIWAGIIGLCCMSIVQAMGFSFLERIGADSGFGVEQVAAVLMAVGFVNLFPTALAAILQKRVAAKYVLMAGAGVQAILVFTVFNSASFWPYAVAGTSFAAVMLFTHVFGFGLLASMETTGRVLAATPAMMMSGAAVGPLLGGTLVKFANYQAVGGAAILIGSVALLCFIQLPRAGTARLEKAGAA